MDQVSEEIARKQIKLQETDRRYKERLELMAKTQEKYLVS